MAVFSAGLVADVITIFQRSSKSLLMSDLTVNFSHIWYLINTVIKIEVDIFISYATIGRVKKKEEPLPKALFTPISPPNFSTINLQI